MEREKSFACCGLACCLCEVGDCRGCRGEGCPQETDCTLRRCCLDRGLAGCWQCEQFPCGELMLQRLRNRAFLRFLKDRGEAALLERLEADERAGMRYHHPGALTGDYDDLGGEEAIYRHLRGL